MLICPANTLILLHNNFKKSSVAKINWKITRGRYNGLINDEIVIPVSRLGINAYLKAFVIKEPDETLYDIDSNVKLICTFDKNKQKRSKNYFELAWYKLASDGQREPKPLKVQKREEGLYLLLGPLTQEVEGTYECAVTRRKVNYYDFKLVRIKLKGKPNV